MRGDRILVVDDERFFREAIGDTLEEALLPFLAVGTGEEALEQALQPEFGAMVLDLELPDLHGLEVYRRLMRLRPELPVIVLSAHTDQGNVLEALRLGAFDYLAKPLHPEELVLALRRALETHDLEVGFGTLRDRVAQLDRSLDALRARAAEEDPEIDTLSVFAVETAANLVGAAKSSLLMLDERGEALQVAANYGRKLSPDEMDPVAVGEGVAGISLARGEPYVVSDIALDGRFPGHEARYDSGAFAVTPLAAGTQALGVLCVADPTGGKSFAPEDLSILRILAGQLGALLAQANASLAVPPNDSPDPADAPPNDDVGAELARAVCDAVTSEVEPARVLAEALRPISERLSAAPVSLFLYDANADRLLPEASWDGGRCADRASLEVAGLAGAVLRGGQPIATGDPSADPRFDPQVDTPENGTPGPLLCAPVHFRGKVLGILRVFPERPEDALPEIAELLTAALSAVVRNVLLYRNLVATIEEVADARRQAAERAS